MQKKVTNSLAKGIVRLSVYVLNTFRDRKWHWGTCKCCIHKAVEETILKKLNQLNLCTHYISFTAHSWMYIYFCTFYYRLHWKMSRILYVLVILLLVSKSAVSVPSCGDVVKDLAPCLSYLQGKDPTPQCCAGVKSLKDLTKTKDDRVVSCNCAKEALSKFQYDPSIIPLLPKKCGVDLNLPPIDKNFDCSK